MRYLCKTQLPEIDRLQFVSFHNPQRFGTSIYLFFTHLFTSYVFVTLWRAPQFGDHVRCRAGHQSVGDMVIRLDIFRCA